MDFRDKVYLVNTGVTVLLTVLALWDYMRKRDRIRGDITLMLGALTGWFVFTSKPVCLAAPFLVAPGIMLVLLKPLFSLRLIHHFRSVNRNLERLALVSAGACITIIAFWWPRGVIDVPSIPPYALIAALYYIVLEAYAVVAFAVEAGRVRGVSRSRLRLLTWAGGLSIASLLPEYTLGHLGAHYVGALLFTFLSTPAIVAYYFGCVPPGWVRRIWQNVELVGFLQGGAGMPFQGRAADTLMRLCTASVAAVGGVKAGALLYDETAAQLVFLTGPEETLMCGSFSAGEGLAWEAWQAGTVRFERALSNMGREEARLAELLQARALYAVPIAAGKRAWGVLLVFLRFGTLFPDEDLALLQLMAEHSALFQELEWVNRERSRFLISVSHDLRTPLAALLAQVELLREGLAADPAVALTHVAEKGLVLKRLIDDLFELTRMEAQQRWDVTRVNVTELVRRSVAGLMPALEAAGLEVEPDIPDEPLWANLAPGKFERVIDNLIENARKYGGSGGWLGVRVAGRGPWLRVEVADRGPGVAPEDRSRVFARFYRQDDARRSSTPGSGLGLAIVREIVLRHGGRLGVESPPEGGACFWVELPRIGL